MKITFKNYTLIYSMGTDGFKTTIVINSNNEANALRDAKKELSMCYGSELASTAIFH